ncbi:MAG: 50S ribosomal protein L6 [Bacteroidia bacterium]|jgi:large subunit ribosomal protein L6|nr:50S ribosomal protein L6 [Bacteroidia bacterium]
MSRIGKLPIKLPAGVSISVDKSNTVTVKGPKGELTQRIDPDIQVEVADGSVQVQRPTDQKRHRAMHGLYRTLINNMVVGVTQGYQRQLELIGVGYKAEAKGNSLELMLGYSHPILMLIPSEVTIQTEQLRGQNPKITLTCIDKQLLGQIASKVRSLRPPEPYKGKGIRYVDEVVRRKAGKAGGKGKK